MNTNFKKISIIGFLSVFLASCSSTPVGPSLTVMPAPGKPFDLFQKEDQECRNYAQSSVGTSADDAAALNTAKTAIVGAAIGALAGAVAGGGKSKNAGTGAAIGMVGGTAVGATQGNETAREVQRRYDIAYQQCMYSKGNQVPGYAIQKAAPPAPTK
jgi:uncharacterized protein YcfJ